MKKELCGFVCGVLLTSLISIGIAHATGTWENISVLRNDINVIVDGNEINADNFLYNDTTYLPMRAIGEALGKDVSYNENTNTAVIKNKGENNLINSNISAEVRDKEFYVTYDGSDKYSVDGIRAFWLNTVDFPYDNSNPDGEKGWVILSDSIEEKYSGDYQIVGNEIYKKSDPSTILFENYPTIANGEMSLEWYDTVFQPWLAENCTAVK